MTELAIHWHHIEQYALRVNTINLGSGHERFEFPFPVIHVDRNPQVKPNFVASCSTFPFEGVFFGQLISSHLIEDFDDWEDVLLHWIYKTLKADKYHVGFRLILLVPDKVEFRRAVENGASDNLAHQHEFSVGELSKFFTEEVAEIDSDGQAYTVSVHTDKRVGRYSILFVVDIALR